ncbi:NAD(P)H-hydrate dehydratase [Candidatus Micrarchaeota archaeon CG1_02_55_41]|nr:MAG: NAD(P)H-hydrate dehydratase [Candidatus Micrarchaeota archaeon CG1_02_55_41]
MLTRAILKKIVLTRPGRKGDNGRLLVAGGSKKYHGAPLLAIKAASRFVDLIYYYSPHAPNAQVKQKNKCFISVEKPNPNRVDCVLIGNGLDVNPENKRLVNQLLKKSKRAVLDAGAIRMAGSFEGTIVTPHAREFEDVFKLKASKANALRVAKQNNCVVLLKGKIDFIASPARVRENRTGNEVMTRGGTGDVLAGLCAALHCKNPAFESACAAAWINGRAGDKLKRRRRVFNAEDLARALPEALK